MLAKNDQRELAIQAYEAAKSHKDFKTWPYKNILENKISNIYTNKKPTLMIESAHSCMGCHQKGE